MLSSADVRAALVRAFRARVWPPRRPAVLPAPAALALQVPANQALAGQNIDSLRARLLALTPLLSPGRITVRRVVEVTAGHFGTTRWPALRNAGRSR